MWFGTQDGLNFFDGYSFVTYRNDPNDSTSISNNYIQTLFEDQQGQLWIGTRGGGLNRFDRKTKIFEHYTNNENIPSSLPNNDPYKNPKIADVIPIRIPMAPSILPFFL